MTFPFQTVYDYFAKPLDGLRLGPEPFGPALIHVSVEDGQITGYKLQHPAISLIYFQKEKGQEELQLLIKKMLGEMDESFCVVLSHEGHAKLAKDDATPEQIEAVKEKGLMRDPDAQHSILMAVYHRSGMRLGILPIKDRQVSYAPLIDDKPSTIHFVKIGADQGLH